MSSPCTHSPHFGLFFAKMLLNAELPPAGSRGSFGRREQLKTAGQFAVCPHLTAAGTELGSGGAACWGWVGVICGDCFPHLCIIEQAI